MARIHLNPASFVAPDLCRRSGGATWTICPSPPPLWSPLNSARPAAATAGSSRRIRRHRRRSPQLARCPPHHAPLCWRSWRRGLGGRPTLHPRHCRRALRPLAAVGAACTLPRRHSSSSSSRSRQRSPSQKRRRRSTAGCGASCTASTRATACTSPCGRQPAASTACPSFSRQPLSTLPLPAPAPTNRLQHPACRCSPAPSPLSAGAATMPPHLCTLPSTHPTLRFARLHCISSLRGTSGTGLSEALPRVPCSISRSSILPAARQASLIFGQLHFAPSQPCLRAGL